MACLFYMHRALGVGVFNYICWYSVWFYFEVKERIYWQVEEMQGKVWNGRD